MSEAKSAPELILGLRCLLILSLVLSMCDSREMGIKKQTEGGFGLDPVLKLIPVQWYQMPSGHGKIITSEAGIAQHAPYIAPVLYGGLGNIMFQLATTHVLGKNLSRPVLVGYWNHWNRQFTSFGPWGGHPAPAPYITLKNVFPQLIWISFQPSYTLLPSDVHNEYAFSLSHPDDYLSFPSSSILIETPWIQGYFFNAKYWHHERDYLLTLFHFHPAVVDFVHIYHSYLFTTEFDTVSLHLRLGYDGESDKQTLKQRTFPSHSWYEHIFTEVFNYTKVIYIVFSDNIIAARQFLSQFYINYEIVDENVVMELFIATKCKHHVLTSSTLSFWGSYLDKKQPHGGRTIVPAAFLVDHGRETIPYKEWEIIGDP